MKKKIMIVDDELEILDVLERFLSRNDLFDIETYSNPVTALEKAKNFRYDLILSDIMMPQVSGLEILEAIKSTNNSAKVALMTAYSNKNKVEKSNELNVDLYIEKPFQNLKTIENQILNTLGV